MSSLRTNILQSLLDIAEGNAFQEGVNGYDGTNVNCAESRAVELAG